MADDSITCSAGCKHTVVDLAEAALHGWEQLPISTRWRCPDCTRELVAARDLPGSDVAPAP